MEFAGKKRSARTNPANQTGSGISSPAGSHVFEKYARNAPRCWHCGIVLRGRSDACRRQREVSGAAEPCQGAHRKGAAWREMDGRAASRQLQGTARQAGTKTATGRLLECARTMRRKHRGASCGNWAPVFRNKRCVVAFARTIAHALRDIPVSDPRLMNSVLIFA
jgi:hypothetical protein